MGRDPVAEPGLPGRVLIRMELSLQQQDHRYLLRCAQRVLAAPVRAVNFAWDIEQRLDKRLRLVARYGLDTCDPLVEIDSSRAGIDVDAGLEHFRLTTIEPAIDLVRVRSCSVACGYKPRYEFWAVRRIDFERLFAIVRRRPRQSYDHRAPVMSHQQQTALWDNTIGFLQQSVSVLQKYGVAQRRGVLLTGEPGNGKTMASRWLRQQCRRHRLLWRAVTADEYQSAYNDNTLRDLFHLRRPGIVQFDDLDQHLRDRNQVGATGGHAMLLTELDGIEPRHGVVFLFTSNARLDQLDPAVRRPGRIDRVIVFARPEAELRRRLVSETWHADLQSALNVSQVVHQTDGFSFAEMDELKKLLVLRFLDTDTWDWPAALESFHANRQEGRSQPIGFQQITSDERGAEPALGISAES